QHRAVADLVPVRNIDAVALDPAARRLAGRGFGLAVGAGAAAHRQGVVVAVAGVAHP
ncbi:hypothetical protein CATMIT_01730, partial [Catenibacterium mitsuokai DSM 15897]